MRAPTANEVVATVVSSCVVVTIARRLHARLARWRRLHSRVDGVTAVSAAQLGLPVDRTPYPAPWNESEWYGKSVANSWRAAEMSVADSFRVNGMRFVGPREWVDQIRAQHGADTPEAN